MLRGLLACDHDAHHGCVAIAAAACGQASSINLDTMVHQPTAAAQHQQAQAVAALPLLGLSEQQQEFISVGTQLYYDLLAAIHQERHKINTEMKAADPDQGGASRASTDDSRVGAGSHACLGSGSEQTLPDRQALLERQQELANRLGLLLRKEVSCSSAVTALS